MNRSTAPPDPRNIQERSRGWLLRNLLLPALDTARGHPMMKRLKMLEEAQWWELDRIEAERDRLLRETLATVHASVSFYRELWDARGIRLSDIRTANDLHHLPVAYKADLRAGYPDRVTRPVSGKTYETSTSGSTGQNFFVREDQDTAGWYRASFLLALEWAGWRVGDAHMQTGMTPDRGLDKRLKDRLLRCHYISAYDLRDDHLDACLKLMDDQRVEHLWGYPGSLYYLAARAKEQGWNRQLRSIVTWGDKLYPAWRQVIESAFGRQVHDTYGCGEGLQMSAQCGQDSRYHIHALDVVMEFVDDEGQAVNAGTLGQVIITRLHPGPMPFIRYANGDIGSGTAGGLCSCGRGFPMMDSIEGRLTDVIVTPSGNRLIVHFFTGILEHFQQVASYQVAQTASDRMEIRVVPGQGYDESVAGQIRQALLDAGAQGIRIDVRAVSDIQLSPAGKRRLVIDETKSEATSTTAVREHEKKLPDEATSAVGGVSNRRTSEAEAERIRNVYAEYAEEGAQRQRWAADNPGNLAIVQERNRALLESLERVGLGPLSQLRILEIGCGHGDVLAELVKLGAQPKCVTGVDLLAESICEGSEHHPELNLRQANAEELPFADGSFDLVVMYTVISSILDHGVAERVCGEANRVLRPGGAVAWYDLRVDNPGNPHVRAIKPQEVERLFPGYKSKLRTLTVLPLVARRLGPATAGAYPLLSATRIMHTHLFGLLIKPDRMQLGGS